MPKKILTSSLFAAMFVAVCSSSCAAVADPPTATYVAGHRIGESFREWLTINQLDLADICQPHKRSDSRMDFKAVCRTLSSIRDTGHGQFYLSIGPTPNAPAFQWVFLGGRLAEASTEYNGHDVSGQIELLAAAYGPASASRTRTYQNGYGATWDCREAAWTMPDGTSITAIEVIRTRSLIPNWLVVKFSSTE